MTWRVDQPGTGSGAARRRWVRLVLVVLGAVVTCGLAAAPASAHDALVSTSPSDHQRVARAPASVVLTFDQPALAMGTQIIVTGPAGPVQQGAPRLVDNTVVQALSGGAPAGDYTVNWRVTSADGHPVSGVFTFSAEAVGTGTAAAASPTPAAPTGSGRSPRLWLAVGLALVVVAGGALFGSIRRRGRTERRHRDS